MLTDAAEKKPPWLKTPDTQRLLTTLAMKSEARNTGPLAVVFRKLLCLPSHSNGTTSLTPLSESSGIPWRCGWRCFRAALLIVLNFGSTTKPPSGVRKMVEQDSP